ncbi:MAG: hypothetical protein KKD44_07565 [Proteobacteria bacterium]|nr:hypothetical protein [Pseudomonadota bacterium]
MLKSRLELIGVSILFCFFALLIAGCSGGGGDGEVSNETIEQSHILSVKATVTFPASSPLDDQNTSVLCGGDISPLNSDNQADIDIVTNRLMDVSVLLPSRDGLEPPTVYLNTTVMPGEIKVDLNIEETAVSLVMTGVDHRYLVDPTTASWVKSLIKRKSTDFIDDLSQKLVQDPYLLRSDTVADALGPLFAQAVADSDAALKALYDPDNTLTAPSKESKALVEIPADAEDFGDFYIVYDRTPPYMGYVFIPPGVLFNDKLTFTNSSMLPVLTRITDTTTHEVIKDIPDTFMGQAFSPDVLSPITGPFGIPLPTWVTIDNGTRNIQVEVFSPGLSDFVETSYFEAGSPCGPLLARASFSGAILPLINVVLPSAATNAVSESLFSILQRGDVFEKILYHWPRGEFSEGITNALDGISTNVISEMAEMLAEKGLLKGDVGPKLSAQLGLKMATAQIAIASAGISIAALSKGLIEAPSKASYQIIYPVGLRDMEPQEMKKRSENETNDQEFSLTGHGLSAVQFEGETHTARLLLEAFNKEDEKIEETMLDEAFGFGIQTVSGLDSITFKLPDAWVETGTEIKYVRLTVHHCYVAPGWLAGYTDWTNYLETVALPYYESSIEKFTIYLTQDLRITSVENVLLEKGGLIIIEGQGFAGDDSGLENEVYFVDKDNQPVSASILSSSETRISAYVPSSLVLNDNDDLAQQHVGSSSVYVELSDGSQSNQVWVAVIPDPVTFHPEPVFWEMTYKDSLVSLSQISGFPINYSINGSNEYIYYGPFTVTETIEITAYAKVLVDGVFYRSRETTHNYVTCEKGETFIPYPHGAQCVVIQNQDLMPRRYCPLDNDEYHGPIQTEFGCVTCSYSWLLGGTDQLAVEKHMDRSQTATFSVTQFWAEPEGRPSNVWRPTANYQFCPDGSFGTACSH